MEKLNKYYLDSWWAKKKSIPEQIKIIKQVSKEYDLRATTKIKPENSGYSIYVKHNKA